MWKKVTNCQLNTHQSWGSSLSWGGNGICWITPCVFLLQVHLCHLQNVAWYDHATKKIADKTVDNKKRTDPVLTLWAYLFLQILSISLKTSSMLGRPLLDLAAHRTANSNMVLKSWEFRFPFNFGSSKSDCGRFFIFTSVAYKHVRTRRIITFWNWNKE